MLFFLCCRAFSACTFDAVCQALVVEKSGWPFLLLFRVDGYFECGQFNCCRLVHDFVRVDGYSERMAIPSGWLFRVDGIYGWHVILFMLPRIFRLHLWRSLPSTSRGKEWMTISIIIRIRFSFYFAPGPKQIEKPHIYS